MAFNQDRAAGCIIGYNSIIKAVKYVDLNNRIDPNASRHVLRVLKVIYGRELYNYYRRRSRSHRHYA